MTTNIHIKHMPSISPTNGKQIEADAIKRVVVRGTRWIGDAVMTLPALAELRRVLPRAHITLATPAWSESVFADSPEVDELLVTPGKARGLGAMWREAQAWRERRFDLAVLFQNSFASALVACLAGVPLRIGYRTDRRGLLLTHALALPSWRGSRHEAFNYLHIVAELERLLLNSSSVNSEDDLTTRQLLHVSAARQREARSLLVQLADAQSVKLELSLPLVVLCPGSTNSEAKRWEATSYARLADRFIEEMNANAALVGAAEERFVSEEVANAMRRRPLMLTGHTDLSETVAVLSIADLVISNDTGPAHIAAALRRPTLVIFGPTDPVTTRPFSATAEIIREPPACAPCMLRRCPIDHRCMTQISPEAVYNRARMMMPNNPIASIVEVAR